MNYKNVEINDNLKKAISEMGYTEATPIQEKCIPLIIEGRDILGQSQTGTGKTAAFALPILTKIKPVKKKKPQVLIMCPTRELCVQIGNEIRKFAKYSEGIKTVCVYGGEPINKQIVNLKGGCDIVVGTPGRLLDHIRRKTLRFDECMMLVLDEADEMLNMGFKEDIDEVIKNLPIERQTVLFSATMPKAILEIADEILTDPEKIIIKSNQLTVESIDQRYYLCNPTEKKNLLMQCIQIMNPKQAMIFCNTKRMVDEVCSELISNHYPAAAIHGDMKQEARMKVMDNFKNKKLAILICTDVAARGIDIDNMDVVYNFDLPQEAEYYVHRIGRTGRAGKKGIAVTFITARQKSKIAQLERLTKAKITLHQPPTNKEIDEIIIKQTTMEIEAMLTEKENKLAKAVINELLDQNLSYEDLTLALVNELLKSTSIEKLNNIIEENSISITSDRKIWITVNVGHNHGVTAAHIVSAIAEATGLNGKDIGKIKIEEKKSYVEIPFELKDSIIKSLKKQTIKGYAITTELLTETPSFLTKYRKGDFERKTSVRKKKKSPNSSKRRPDKRSSKHSNKPNRG